MAKSTKRQMVEREDDIVAYLREGRDIHQFGEILAKKHNCSKASIERQYRSIMNSLVEIQKEQREELRAKLLFRSDVLYTQAVQAGNIKNAIDAVNLTAKIGGLYQPDQKPQEEKPSAPVFKFTQRDDSVPLTVVPKDDNDKDASNN